MKFSIEQKNIDLGETSIENLFLKQYLPLADGNSLKVYLYCYYLSKNQTSPGVIDLKDLGDILGLTRDEVEDAILYWLNEGIIRRSFDPEADENTFSFLSMRELYFGFNEAYKHDQTPVFRKMNQEELKGMFEAIESILGLELTPNEIQRILDHMDSLGQSPDLIATGFQYCAVETGKKNLNYVLTVLRNWHLDGINTLEDFLKHEEEKKKEEKARKRKRKYFKPEKKEKQNLQQGLKNPGSGPGTSDDDIIYQQLMERLNNKGDKE